MEERHSRRNAAEVGLWTLDCLSKLLSDLFSAEGANAVEAEAEHHAVFLSDTDVESVVLGSHCAAVPTVAERDGRTNQSAIAASLPRLKVEKERRSTEEAAFAVAQKDGRTPL